MRQKEMQKILNKSNIVEPSVFDKQSKWARGRYRNRSTRRIFGPIRLARMQDSTSKLDHAAYDRFLDFVFLARAFACFLLDFVVDRCFDRELFRLDSPDLVFFVLVLLRFDLLDFGTAKPGMVWPRVASFGIKSTAASWTSKTKASWIANNGVT